jgi:diguanylate cyclase (GGDEF)-like protein/putative nucleotidyltransferase with HDIG domain
MSDGHGGTPYRSPKPVVAIRPDDLLATAGSRMREHDVGCLVVQDDDGLMVGVISERDLIANAFGAPDHPPAERVCDIMTRDVASCPPDAEMREVQRVMAERRVRHLPLVRDGRCVGMISAREVTAYQRAEDVAMRDAAERIARLYGSLRSVDFEELVELTAREVPRVLGAAHGVLCLPDKNDQGEPVWRIRRTQCGCPEEDLLEREADLSEVELDPLQQAGPEACRQAGLGGDSVLLPLRAPTLAIDDPDDVPHPPGFLCMCGVDGSLPASSDLIRYKALLLHETIGANLVKARLLEDYKRVWREAATDSLTGLGSRRAMEDRLEQECQRAGRYGRMFSLAFLDVDNFKLINDQFGHAAGDEVLRGIAEAMRQEKRGVDVLVRYGGDEFVLLMPETRAQDAVVLLDRIRARISGQPIGPDICASVSVGIVQQTPSAPVSASELIRRADLAMYQAKRCGRNRVECWQRVPGFLRPGGQAERDKVRALRGRVADLVSRSKETFMQSIRGLVRALDARDPHTRSHSENVTRFAMGIAGQMNLADGDVDVIRRAAILHDIGKIGLPDNILRKPGPLTDAERHTMEEHPLIAVSILSRMHFLERELPLVRQHHERWDGRGYPDGLAGNAIAPGARVLAVADALDAITSARNYHQARSLPEAMAIIQHAAGNQFDPEVVAALVAWRDHVAAQRPDGDALTAADLLATQPHCGVAA